MTAVVLVIVVFFSWHSRFMDHRTQYTNIIITYTHICKCNQWWQIAGGSQGNRSSSSWQLCKGLAAAKWATGWAGTGTSKFYNSVIVWDTYFSKLYTLKYKSCWFAVDSISSSDMVPWCYWYYSIIMLQKFKQLYHQSKRAISSWCLRPMS